MLSISNACKDYFNGFQDVQLKENTASKKALGLLKIVSYFSLVLPIFVGIMYATTSLIGRVTTKKDLNSEDQRVCSARDRTIGQKFENKLNKLFSAKVKHQVLFNIDGHKVGVIFNPKGEALRIGFLTVANAVVLIYDKPIPAEIRDFFATKIASAGHSYSTLSFGSINGQPTFKYLGFE